MFLLCSWGGHLKGDVKLHLMNFPECQNRERAVARPTNQNLIIPSLLLIHSLEVNKYIGFWTLRVNSIWDLWVSGLQECKSNNFFFEIGQASNNFRSGP